ncbi:unnamed protein product, partial [Adineta steineri]
VVLYKNILGPDAHNELRTICEQQRVELEYLRNVMTQQQYSTMTQPVENGVEQLNLNNHENHFVRLKFVDKYCLISDIHYLNEFFHQVILAFDFRDSMKIY